MLSLQKQGQLFMFQNIIIFFAFKDVPQKFRICFTSKTVSYRTVGI